MRVFILKYKNVDTETRLCSESAGTDLGKGLKSPKDDVTRIKSQHKLVKLTQKIMLARRVTRVIYYCGNMLRVFERQSKTHKMLLQ